jgi:hypothetical protein
VSEDRLWLAQAQSVAKPSHLPALRYEKRPRKVVLSANGQETRVDFALNPKGLMGELERLSNTLRADAFAEAWTEKGKAPVSTANLYQIALKGWELFQAAFPNTTSGVPDQEILLNALQTVGDIALHLPLASSGIGDFFGFRPFWGLIYTKAPGTLEDFELDADRMSGFLGSRLTLVQANYSHLAGFSDMEARPAKAVRLVDDDRAREREAATETRERAEGVTIAGHGYTLTKFRGLGPADKVNDLIEFLFEDDDGLHLTCHADYNDLIDSYRLDVAVARQLTLSEIKSALDVIAEAHHRVAFVNACHGAFSTYDSEDNPSLAELLVRSGTEFVIAPSAYVDRNTAASFASAFYREAASGIPCGQAFRAALKSELEQTQNPVLLTYCLFGNPMVTLTPKRAPSPVHIARV